ncbi:MAG: hypothetical protein Q9157_006069 [Trypethelium eluteriae]
MEGIHGVDVSWLHHSNKEHHHRLHAPSSPGLSRDTPPPTSSHGGLPKAETQKPLAVQPPQFPATEQVQENTPPPAPPKPASKRPNILSRSSSEKLPSNQTSPPDGSRTPPRRGSWISNISSKFSSQNQTPFQPPHQPFQAPPTTPPRGPSNSDAKGSISSTINGTTVVTSPSSTTPGRKEEEEMAPYVPQPPKAGGGSFFSSALKRLSSGSQLSPSSKSASNGGVIPRKVMNIDSQRPRCLVPELDDKKLRRVAFSVDVEIAGGPRYTDEEEDTSDKKKREKGLKMKEKGEGAALKNPQAVAQEKDSDGVIHATGEPVSNESDPNYERAMPNSEQEPGEKKEKKKRTEEEKKERKERKRRKAEESGSVPVEVTRDSEENSSGSPPISSTPPRSGTPPRPQDRPTTDPVRIYRRCCQLRETPVLKRISEQLSLPSTCALDTPGIVGTLDLTGSRLQLADLLTLGDWLAVVPVKRLLLEDADLTDEGVRVILAGLLAAKTPEEMSSRRHYGRHNSRKAAQRTGVVEKLVLKNNPRITKLGWKHISLFLYMCRSLKSIDVSMITFPKTLSSSAVSSPNGDRTIEASKSPENVAEIFAKSLSERLGGSTLEELIMAECGLTALCIRKVVDAVTVSGVRRLGLASNHLDDEGLEHVLHFLKSGICQGLDIGGNDLRDRLDRLADVLTDQNNLWALCLADCNLSPASLKPLFPALVRLPAFKFIDLSHNRDLFSTDPSALGILRKYIPQMHDFKRLHLVDVSLSPAQAISLAEILPEGPSLAHLNILENPQLSALASAQDEAGQEEACALYASLMAAARVSESIICIDIDVPSQGTSEVVKALARQVVAYCLRNIQRWTTSDGTETASAKASLAGQHGGETDVAFPDVLLHLVGHVEGVNENHDADDPAPDDDYIVGGTGVVKALSYVLGEKARRSSMPASGTVTPKDYAKATEDGKGRAMNMSKNLLGSARKIRDRLRPALVKEANAGDETAYRKSFVQHYSHFSTNTIQGASSS